LNRERKGIDASAASLLALSFSGKDSFDEGPQLLSRGEAHTQARLDVFDPAGRKSSSRISPVAELDDEGT
jgi:hypothetical protein